MKSFSKDRRDVLKLGAAAAATAMLPALPAFAQQTEITVWGWASTLPGGVEAYLAANPDRKVNLITVSSADLNLKLRNALRAGSGMPDVAQMQRAIVPSFALTNSLTDLSSYGLPELKDQYVQWAWDQFTDGDKIYSLPWDIGPVATYYRQDIFEKYGLELPVTYDDLLAQGEKLKAQTNDVFITSGNFNQPEWFYSSVWQAGGRLFAVDSEKINIAINSPEAKKFAEFWQIMLDKGYVDSAPSYNTDWFASMDAGRYASWIAPKWATNRLTSTSSESIGKWRIAPLPQWTATDHASGNWGGSALVVPKGAANAEASAHFIKWMLAGDGAQYFVENGLWPTKLSILEAPDFVNQTHELYGDQKVNPIFIDSAAHVNTNWQYSPFQEFVDAQVTEKLSAAAIGKVKLVDALDQLQEVVSTYAQQQGFTVIE